MKIKIKKISKLNLATKAVLVFMSCLMIFAAPMQSVKDVYAYSQDAVDQLQVKIDSLNQDIAAYHAEAAKLGENIQTLQATLTKLANEKAIIQAQVDINQAKYDQLEIQIANTEKQIKDNQDALGITIADMYVDNDVTPLEMLASSDNIGDYLDKQEYKTSIRKELSSTISKIKELKQSLVSQKADVEKVLNDQKNAKQTLSDKESEQASILAATQGQEAAYQQLSVAADSKKSELVQQQQAIINYVPPDGVTSNISDPTKGNYPWGGSGCTVKEVWYTGYYSDGTSYKYSSLDSFYGINGDGSDALGYACRQCTSYAAWKIYEHTGEKYRFMGNAANWPNSFGQYNKTPRENSVGVISGGGYGHVVWVERMDPDNSSNIIISQYNDYDNNTGDNSGKGWGNYSKRSVPKSTYNYFIYF